MKLTQQLKKSQKGLESAGTLFVTDSRQNTEELIQRALGAGNAFVEDTKEATTAWVEGTRAASNKLGTGLKKEAVSVQKLTQKQVDTTKATLQEKAQQSGDKAKALTLLAKPTNVERLVLEAVKSFLTKINAQIDTRLTTSEKAPSRARRSAARTKAKAQRTTAHAKTANAEPLRNYDALSARDVVAKLQRISAPKADAVLQYEKAGKNRATVLRAARQRVAA